MSQSAPKVLVIGAGPAGCYATRHLAAQGVEVAVVNRDLRPGGMATYGLHPCKQAYKQAMDALWQEILSHPRVHYFGGVEYGPRGMLAQRDLQQLGFGALLFAVGAQGTHPIDIAGLPAHGAFPAKAWLASLQGMESPQSFSLGARVGVVGSPDLAAEVALALCALEEPREITLFDPGLGLWRSGPRSCQESQLRHIAHAIDPLLFANELKRIESSLQQAQENPVAIQRRLTEARQKARFGATDVSIRFRLLAAVGRVHSPGGRVAEVEYEHMGLQWNDGEWSSASVATGIVEKMPLDTLLYAAPDMPDSRLGLAPQEGHAIAQAPGCFVAGWARDPQLGLNIGKARKDGEAAAEVILAHLQQQAPQATPALEALHGVLDQKGARYIGKPELSLLLSSPHRPRGESFEALDAALLESQPKSRTPRVPQPIVLQLRDEPPAGLHPLQPGQWLQTQVTRHAGGVCQLQSAEGMALSCSTLPTGELPAGTPLSFYLEAVDGKSLRCSPAKMQWSLLSHIYKIGQAIEVEVLENGATGIWVKGPDGSQSFLPHGELDLDAQDPQEQERRRTPGSRLAVWVRKVRNHRIELTTRKYTVCPPAPGDVLRGTIENVGANGVSVKLDDAKGTRGLLPTSELSWSRRISHPNEYFPFVQGASLHVQVRGFNWEGMPDLSLKAIRPNPWDDPSRFHVGQRTQIFFSNWLKADEKFKGFQGFIDYDIPAFAIDIPLLPNERNRNLFQLLEFQVGEQIPAVVKDVDPQGMRVFVSILEAQPELLMHKAQRIEQKLQPGAVLRGTVLSTSPAEAQLLLEEFQHPMPLTRQGAVDFLASGQSIEQIIAPEQSVFVEIASYSFEQQLQVELALRGIGPPPR